MKRGREYHGCWKEYKVKKRGSNTIFPIILRLLGRILSWEVDGNSGEENQDLKNGVGEEYQVIGNFIIRRWDKAIPLDRLALWTGLVRSLASIAGSAASGYLLSSSLWKPR